APSLTEPSEIRIRRGFNGTTLASADWTGLHPNADDPYAGIGSSFTFAATGVFDSAGALTLTFTLTDAGGHSQTIETTIENPIHGTTFGFGGRTHGSQEPIAEFRTFAMELGEAPGSDGPSFAGWKEEHFTPAQIADEAVSGPEADPA